MRLFEHPDFADIVEAATQELRASRWPRISAAIVEKDYYVTEVLRICALHQGDRVLLKGGTSLSKGWGLIQRFSEDVDLAVIASRFTPPLSRGKTKAALRALAERVSGHPALTCLADRAGADSDFFRDDRFGYTSSASGLPGVSPTVLLEAGSRSGHFPVETCMLSSMVGDSLRSRDLEGLAEDTEPFPMQLLHYRRTFLEKLYALHHKVESILLEGSHIGAYARHYYDVAALAGTGEVRDMLAGQEAAAIRADYDANCRKHFKHQILPPHMRLRESRALFPPAEVRQMLTKDYEEQCSVLCFTDTWPTFDEVLGVFEELRDLL